MPADGRHDFDFLHGRWRVQNERLVRRLAGCDDWEVFAARVECRPVLGGLGNLEEFRTAWAGGYAGLALRLYDLASGEWRIHWASSATGALDPPVTGRFAGDVGTFHGEDVHDGHAVRVRFQWTRTGTHGALWQQAFSSDGGAHWETNWRMWFRREDADGRLLHADAVVELRQYTLQPGARDTLVELFEREFVETQEAVGMHVIGTFRDLDAPDRFVWLRGFASMDARREALQGFYDGPVWRRHRAAANATMIDSDDVLLLKPATPDAGLGDAPPRPAPDAVAPAGALCVGICTLHPDAAAEFPARFEDEFLPLLRAHDAQVLARYVTEPGANTFPRLPVRAGERVLVWLARFADVARLDAHLAALQSDPGWRGAVAVALADVLVAPPQLLRLAPTARSELR
jgi:hypothetical protein